MYVCICHALRGRDVERATTEGISRVADVHRHFGVKVQCGRCVPCIRDMLSESGKTSPREDWLPAGSPA